MGIRPDALYLDLLSDLSNVCENDGVQSYAARLLAEGFLKKLRDTNKTADIEALSRFISANSKCADYPGLQPRTLADVMVDACAVHRLDRFAITLPGDLTLYDFGPGASNSVKGTSFFHKISGELSTTDGILYGEYLSRIRVTGAWLAAEQDRRSQFSIYKKVAGNKLCFVPKNIHCSRVIATEPSLNMFLQKGLGRALEDCLRSQYRIDIADQQFRNRRMARIGSKGRKFATIDLSSASDSVSLRLCEELLPPLLLESLLLIRSPFTQLPDGSQLKLDMISSMGNATTFPLQTIIFATIVLSCYDVLGITPVFNHGVSDGNFGVFGDDIIILEEAYSFVSYTLGRYGFTLNPEKSFHGYVEFRESCGGDYYRGRNVRPVYCYSLKTMQDRYSLINRLCIWGARHGISLSNTLRTLMKSVKLSGVPLYESVSSGIRVPCGLRALSNQLFSYKRYTPQTKHVDIYDESMQAFPNAIFASALQGCIYRGVLTVRLNEHLCNFRRAFTPVWDECDRTSLLLEDLSDNSYICYLIEHVSPYFEA